MSRHFSIHYITSVDESFLILITPEFAKEETAYQMTNNGGTQTFEYRGAGTLSYRYAIKTPDGIIKERHKRFIAEGENVHIIDSWRSPEMSSDILRAHAFASAIFDSPTDLEESPIPTSTSLTIRLNEARLNPNEAFCIVCKQFINWNTERALIMTRYKNNIWQYTITDVALLHDFEFKFGIWDTQNNCFKRYEEGDNHIISQGNLSEKKTVVTYDTFNYADQWRCAGVSVPIFSLRSSKSRGCGEFSDLKPLADWCVDAGLKIIQLLPINDTTATGTFKDSYPYNAISVMALHPNYVSVDEVFAYYNKIVPSIERETGLFINDLNFVDYTRTNEWKLKNLRILFADDFKKIMSDKRFKEYIEKNAWWVKDYAAFSVLRDKFGTACFHNWEEGSVYSPMLVETMFNKKSSYYKKALFYIFLQFHLEIQLCDAIEYIHCKNIALKGDLPIGVNPNSVEAWVAPELFNFGLQAGAPPDFFSRDGQNWGFPTYKWEVMAQDGFAWWTKRLGRMQQFFDLFRIDHILGFFRIWAIPRPFKSGLMGIFSPALPYSAMELSSIGLNTDLEMFTLPVVSSDFIERQINIYANKAKNEIFNNIGNGLYKLKKEFFSPTAVAEWIKVNVSPEHKDAITNGFNEILHEVLFINIVAGEYHPRIMLTETERFQLLHNNEKEIFSKIYEDFFFHRHNQYWKEVAIRNLEGMLKECDMLVCGEDLGMIPSSVPTVMKRLQILALELQRMPKLNWERYGNCSCYQYDSVCATSSHDISSIRGWWEENETETQWYYNNILNHDGKAPKAASGDIVAQVLNIHMQSPSILCINPIQDYAGIVDNMPHLLPFEERINEPANSNHYWRYRIPFKLDELVTKYPELHIKVRDIVTKSKR